MSSSISAATIGNNLSRTGTTSVEPSRPANSSPTGTTPNLPVTDTVSLSAQARTMLAVNAELAAFEATGWSSQSPTQTARAGYAAFQEPISADGELAASAALSSTELSGSAIVNEVIDGSTLEDDVTDSAVFGTNPEPSTVFQASVIVGNGNSAVTAATDMAMYVPAGMGNDRINAAATEPNGMSILDGKAGNDTISPTKSGIVLIGNGNDAINLKYAGGSTLSPGIAETGGGAVINGNGPGTFGYVGRGVTPIDNLGNAEVVGFSVSTSVINPGNEAYNQAGILSGLGSDGGSTAIKLSNPAARIRDDTHPYSRARTQNASDKTGNRLQAVAAIGDRDHRGDHDSYVDALPTEGQAEHGLVHTRLDFVGITADQVSSTLQGSTLTVTVASTGQTVTVNDYLPGRVTFTFASSSNSGDMAASRQPPRLSRDGTRPAQR